MAASTPLIPSTGIHPRAQWIWLGTPAAAHVNATVAFRKQFTFDAAHLGQRDTTLDISADTHYRLFLNDEWVGDGPARGYPQHYYFDRYHVAPLLQPGENVIAVLVVHHGVTTFHHCAAAAGLLLSLSAPQRGSLISDGSWHARLATEFSATVPRISCQQGFEEHVDPRNEPQDADWQLVDQVRDQEQDDHQGLCARDVRLLSRSPLPFRRWCMAEAVSPIAGAVSIKVRETITVHGKDSNLHGTAGVFAAAFECDTAATFEWSWLGPLTELVIDGVPVEPQPATDGIGHGRAVVAAGRHLLCLPVVTRYDQVSDLTLGYTGNTAIEWRSLLRGADTPWCCVGPLWEPPDATNCYLDEKTTTRVTYRHGANPQADVPASVQADAMALAHCATELEFRERAGPELRALTPTDLPIADALFACRTDAGCPDITVQVENPDACFTANPEMTVIHPVPGRDLRILIDLDEMSVGYFEFDLLAEAGTVIDGYFVEHVTRTGSGDLLVQHTGTTRNSFRYTCRSGRNQFVSRQRRGMRYAFLTFRHLRAPVRLRHVGLIEATYPVSLAGSFHCDDERLNRIHAISRRTLQLCMEDVLTDCPLYEQTLWLGDARNEARFVHATFWAPDLVQRCCRLGAQSLDRMPLVGSQVPSGWENILTAWSLLWEIMVWETYLYTGDREFLAEMYPAMMVNLENAVLFCNDDGLLSLRAWNMFDWAGMDDCHDTVLHNSLFLVGALDAAHRAARALRKSGDTTFCREWRTRVATAVMACWDPGRNAFPDAIDANGKPSASISQHTSALALLYNLLPAAQKKAAVDNLLAPPDEMVKIGSPFAMFYMLEALEAVDQQEAALRIIADYWGIMLEHDAKTCWETVQQDFLDGKTPFATRSHCHGWSAAPVDMFARMLLGVTPLKPGFREARIRPCSLGLRHAKGSVPTPHGLIHVAWHLQDDGSFDLAVDAPPAVTLRVDRSRLRHGNRPVRDASKAR